MFDQLEQHLDTEWKSNLLDLFSISSVEEPKRIDTLIQNIARGEYWTKRKQDIIDKYKEEINVPVAKALLAKDEGLISDAVYNAFVNECGLANMPRLHLIKALRQTWNEIVEKELEIKKINGLPEGSSGYQVNIRKVIQIILGIVKTFSKEELASNHLLFKLSIDGRFVSGKKEVLVGLIPMNMGFVVSSEEIHLINVSHCVVCRSKTNIQYFRSQFLKAKKILIFSRLF